MKILDSSKLKESGIPCGSVVKCLTHNPVVRTAQDPLGIFVEVSFVKTLRSPSLVQVKPRKDMNNVSCCRDKTEKLLKSA